MKLLPIQIIAEIGINHDGKIDKAYKLVDEAARAGANLIKFQTAIPELVQSPNSPKAKYQELGTLSSKTALEMTKNFHLSLNSFNFLKDYVESLGLTFFSTPFDLESAKYLNSIGQTLFKIPSGEIDNWPLLEAIAQYAEEIIISTGIAKIDEIEKCVNYFKKFFTNSQITVMQCDSSYPAQLEFANINVLSTYRNMFETNIGYSDHTTSDFAAMAAAVFGLKFIEKHITLNKNDLGPDHKSSYNPEEFTRFVQNIRNIEKALGSYEKTISPQAFDNFDVVRRGLYYSRDIHAGQKLSIDDIVLLRPRTNLNPDKLQMVIGSVINRNVKKFEKISIEHLNLLP